MVLEEIISQLPKNSEAIKKVFENCLERKKFIEIKKEEFITHLEKAKSDLKNIANDYEKKAWDWVVIKSYYAIHHAINALLVNKRGFFSKDHICGVIALKNFEIIDEAFYNKLKEINEKFSDFTAFDIMYSLRKLSQYDVIKWKDLSESDAKSIYSFAKEFISFVERKCYE